MTQATVPYDMGWTCRGCEGPKLPGDPLCAFCQDQRGGSRSDPRIQVQVPRQGIPTKEEEEDMEKKNQKKEPKGPSAYTKVVGEQVSRAVLALVRAQKLLRDVQLWKQDGVTAAATDLVKTSEKLIGAFEALPKDYKPATVSTGIAPGDKVSIADRAREQYVGFIQPADMDGAEVVAIQGPKVLVKLKNGVQQIVPRGHLHRPQATAGAAK